MGVGGDGEKTQKSDKVALLKKTSCTTQVNDGISSPSTFSHVVSVDVFVSGKARPISFAQFMIMGIVVADWLRVTYTAQTKSFFFGSGMR